MADFNELLPEEADVQDQRLIHDLRRMYRTDTQTIEHLARVRHRLPINDDSSGRGKVMATSPRRTCGRLVNGITGWLATTCLKPGTSK